MRGKRVITDWPGLSDSQLLENRDLRPTTALDSVIAGAIAGHLGISADRVMARLLPDASGNALGGLMRA